MLACDGRAATPPPAAPESTVACTVTVSPGEDVASQLSPDATICLAAGVHRVNLDLTHGVTLRGEPGTVLDGGGRGPVVRIGANVAVDFRPRATCAVCLIQEGGAWWGHIGDSRIYHMRDGHVLRRSRDHSHVEVLIQEGAITEEEALDHPLRNFVECCVGGDAPVPDMSITKKMPLDSGDVLLACTDGLWSGITDEEMADMATQPGEKLADNLKALSVKALTLNAPYSDNTTGTVLQWNGS